MPQIIVLDNSNTVCAIHNLDDEQVYVPYAGYTYTHFSGTAEIGWKWDGETAAPPILTLAQAKAAIQSRLDSAAKAWEYDDIKSAVGYIGDPNPKYNAEGLVLRNFRSATWTKAEEVQMADEPPTNISQLISLLPPLPERPQPPYGVVK